MRDNTNYKLLKKYKDKKVLVTGGAGFVGCNLVRALSKLNANITIIDDLFTGSRDNLKDIAKYKFIKGDIRDEKLIKKLVPEFEYIFHLAARNIIISTKNPKEDYSVNTGGTLNLLLGLRESHKIKKFIYASSVSIYGNPEYLPINENDRVNVLSPYSVSKLGGENYTRVFYEQFNLPVVIIRYSNVYGDHQTSSNPYCGVVGKFIELISNNKPPQIHGDGEQTRDFTYIKDAVEATLLAGISEKSTGDTFNIGTGIEININSLSKILNDIYKKDLKPIYIDRRDIDNIRRRVLSIDKIRQKLKWFPQYNLKSGLIETVKWYEQNKRS